MAYPRRYDHDQAVKDYASGLSMAAVAKKHGVTHIAILNMLTARGEQRRQTKEYRKPIAHILRALATGKSLSDVAKELKVTAPLISIKLRRIGLGTKYLYDGLKVLTPEQLDDYCEAIDKDQLPHQEAYTLVLGLDVEFREKRELVTTGANRRKRWTDAEKEFLIQARSQLQLHHHIATKLGRTEEGVRGMAAKLGITDKDANKVAGGGLAVKGFAKPLEERAALSKALRANKAHLKSRAEHIRKVQEETRERRIATLRFRTRGFHVPPEREAEYKLFQSKRDRVLSEDGTRYIKTRMSPLEIKELMGL